MTTPQKNTAEGRRKGACEALFPLKSRRNSGAALLIVLVFILILAVVLVTFLSNSQRALQQTESSSTILKTQLLGDVALAAVVDDIADEMRAGADADPAEGAAMEISQPPAMKPSRVLKNATMASDPKFANLVKQSAYGVPFFPNAAPYRDLGKLRASGDSTFVESRNQRKISGERWNAPKLLGDSTGLGTFTDAQVPDWIYITRSGAVETGGPLSGASNKAPSNTAFVLGRFAYNIYQVDGLLDINVAGYDANDAKTSAVAPMKGSTALADLTAIPGLSNATTIAQIVDWRNKESRNDYPLMIAGLKTGDSSMTEVRNWGEPAGYQQPFTDGTKTDNRFFSRQDLLKYFAHEFKSGTENYALPYLTTFSADLNQPSVRPDPARPTVVSGTATGGNSAYQDEQLSSDRQINAAMLKVLDNEQNPVVRQRFPLDRLKYVTPDPQPAVRQKISDYFGLEWNNNAWVYNAGKSDGSIKKLHEMGDRAPNMIELLKAAIAIGSLGGQLNYGEARAGIIKTRDSNIDNQIIRIAACIIDQYDADSYPTQIVFNGNAYSGVEDLPYLYGLRVGAYRLAKLVPNDVVNVANRSKFPTNGTPADDFYSNVAMIQPILWNPHAQTAGGDRPSEFRITASTIPPGDTLPVIDTDVVAKLRWWANGSGAYGNDLPMEVPDARYLDPRGFDPSLDYITFNVALESSSPASFREPYTLKAPDYPSGTGARLYDSNDDVDGESADTTVGSFDQNDTANGENTTQAIGFRAAYCWSGPWVSQDKWMQMAKLQTSGISFELQYKTPAGWVTYDKYEKFATGTEQFDLGRYNHGAAYINQRFMRFYLRIDPRTDRYGTRNFYTAPKTESDVKGLSQGRSIRSGDGTGHPTVGLSWPSDALGTYRFNVPTSYFLGQLSENKSTNNGVMFYGDPDGVKRLAMGGYAATGGVDGLPMAQGNFQSRPVILNRPFRSVAELGYAMRDQPWKQLDFFSPESGDAALLDMFCMYEPKDTEIDPVVAGRVNLNSTRPEVIEALLRGVKLTEDSALSEVDAKNVAQALVNWTSSTDEGKGPLRNRSELVGKFVKRDGANFIYSGFSQAFDSVFIGANKMIPLRRQNVLRALVDSGTARSWNFLIDLIVQDGQFSSTGTAGKDFTVRGEKRYWVHLGIDRFTGEVISKRVEEVHE